MTTWTMKIACALLVLAPAVHADDPAKGQPAMKGQAAMDGEAKFIMAKDIKWGEAPPDLPKGAKFIILYGDPMKPGPYTIRLKAPNGYKIPPHWHSLDEQLTVLSGALVMRMGDSMKGDAHTLTADGFHFLPAKMHHSAEMKGETIVQVHGEGPFDIHYLNPADNPNPKAAKK